MNCATAWFLIHHISHIWSLAAFIYSQKRFGSNEEVIATTNDYFEGLEKNYYLEDIEKFKNRWAKCTYLKGNYVQK